jgi:MFS family permease
MVEKSGIQHDEQSMESNQEQPPLQKEITYEEEARGYHAGWHTWAAIIALSLSNCCAVFVNTTNTIIKFQVMSVGDAPLASWIANGNFLLTLTFGPIFGSLSDRLGKKWSVKSCHILEVVPNIIIGSFSVAVYSA